MVDYLDLVKCQGLGNDFLIAFDFADELTCETSAIKKICDRHFGIGADGFIRVTYGDVDSRALFRMELYNQDGSVAEMSGNGLRAMAHCIWDAGFVDAEEFKIATLAGDRSVRLITRDNYNLTAVIEEQMGEVKLESAALPEGFKGFRDNLGVFKADIGNPHFIIFVDKIDSESEEMLGVLHDQLSGSFNTELVAPKSDDCLEFLVYERGIGKTLSCGTGSVAAARAFRELGHSFGEISVVNPGGTLVVEIKGNDNYMTGETSIAGYIRAPKEYYFA
jgi:diaminopimelate epimerase